MCAEQRNATAHALTNSLTLGATQMAATPSIHEFLVDASEYHSAVPAVERGAERYRLGIRDAVHKSYWLGALRTASLGARLMLGASWSATVDAV